MKKRTVTLTALFLVLSLAFAFAVSAVDEATAVTIEPIKDKVYYAYYNTSSGKGAVAFCLNNKFTEYGKSSESISVCIKNADGTYSVLHSIPKDAVDTWFSGTTELKLKASENVSALLGGLSGLGFTVDSEKTNVAFKLFGQSIDVGGEYYIYIPAYYFLDEAGNGNSATYVSIEKEKVNSYTGDLLEDLKSAGSQLYDIALWGFESVAGIF